MIPKHFHFVFGLKPQDEPFHLVYYLCLRSCIEINRPTQVSFYYHYEPYGRWWDAIRQEIDPVEVDLVDSIRLHPAYDQHQEGRFIRQMKLDYAHQADVVRLEQLIRHGGVYADMDTLFINAMPESFYRHQFVIGEEGDIADNDGTSRPSLCNALMLSAADARFPRRWLENTLATFDGSWSRHSNIEATRLAQRHDDEITILPQRCFYRHSFTREGIRALFLDLDDDFDGMYSMHLWNHLWWSPQRTDFSTIHGGQITEDYVRRANTTYAVAARRFLD